MENLLLYFIKVSGLLIIFYLTYSLLLQKETFFTANRWFLIGGLFTSLLLPFYFFEKVVFVATPKNTFQDVIVMGKNTVAATNHFTPENQINWFFIFICSYLIVAAFLGFKIIAEIVSLFHILNKKDVVKEDKLAIVDLNKDIAPFSFFNYIVYNSRLYSDNELQNILSHERIHSQEKHSFDILISKMFCVVFWFNPFVWLYKKALIQNLEYIADQKAIQNTNDKKAYQITLLKIVSNQNCFTITNSFYQSLIKKRIVMLNKTQSKKWNSWKYALIIPSLVAFVILFQVRVIAQEKTNDVIITSGVDKVVLDVNSNSTEKGLNDESLFFKKEFNLDLSFSKIKVNSNNQIIAITVVLKNAQGIKKVYVVKENSPIKPFAIFAEKEKLGTINFGFQANSKDNENLKQHFDQVNKLNNKEPNTYERGTNLVEKNSGSWSFNGMKKDGKDYLVIINGKKQANGSPIKIPLNEEIDTKLILESQAAISKYGKDGTNGAIAITTKKIAENELDLDTQKVLKKTNETKKDSQIEKALIIINGNKVGPEFKIDDLDPKKIESVSVLKDKNATNKYGPEAANGAIEIILKNKSGWEMSFEESQPEDNITRIQNNKNVDYKKAIIIINGKISDIRTMEKLQPEDIKSVGIQMPSNGPEYTKQIALKKYGEKALNGIIEIETKEFQKN